MSHAPQHAPPGPLDLASRWQALGHEWAQWYAQAASGLSNAAHAGGAAEIKVPAAIALDPQQLAQLNAKYQARWEALWSAAALAALAPDAQGRTPIPEITHPAPGDRRFAAREWPAIEDGSVEAIVYAGIVRGIRDYVTKNGFPRVLLGLSGGIDSALTLALAVDALGAERCTAVMMPSRYTSDLSVGEAAAQARRLGVEYQVLPIEQPFEAFRATLAPVFAGKPEDITEENLQARCRGVLLMALSNKFGGLVLSTGNKSEMAVGYATLYGDMCGGYAPLKDVYKTLVWSLSRWRNAQERDGGPVIPPAVIDRPPSAELRNDQLDQDSLPPYDVLDAILERFVDREESQAEIVAAGFDEATVRRVARLVLGSEYKRRQSAPGPKITTRAFGRNRRYPISSGWR